VGVFLFPRAAQWRNLAETIAERFSSLSADANGGHRSPSFRRKQKAHYAIKGTSTPRKHAAPRCKMAIPPRSATET